MPSWFGLSEPKHLFAKLERERILLQENPLDVDLALNFCMTGYHLMYWLYPGDQGCAKRTELKAEPLLQVLGHLANGAKHFQLDDQRHSAVRKSGGAPSRFETPFGLGPGAAIVNRLMLYISLDGEARQALGWVLSILDLADRTIQFWQPRIG